MPALPVITAAEWNQAVQALMNHDGGDAAITDDAIGACVYQSADKPVCSNLTKAQCDELGGHFIANRRCSPN